MQSIGTVEASRREAEDDFWGNEQACIRLNDLFSEESLRGLAEFSHVEVLYFFHQVGPEKIVLGARHPRGNQAWPLVGIFAQRGKNRPNRIGSTICKVVRVEGNSLFVSELDAIDGTPVLDLKPVMAEFLPRGEVRQPPWSRELMQKYWLPSKRETAMAESELSGIHNYRAVDESLCTSGQPTAAQLAAIAAAGFETIINLALHDDPRYSLPDEPGVVESLGLAYVHIPVQFARPAESDLLAFFAAMESHSGERLWVHCAANMRVSAFLGLYRVIKRGWAVEPAFELMRGLWQPNDVWSSFIDAALEKHGA